MGIERASRLVRDILQRVGGSALTRDQLRFRDHHDKGPAFFVGAGLTAPACQGEVSPRPYQRLKAASMMVTTRMVVRLSRVSSS